MTRSLREQGRAEGFCIAVAPLFSGYFCRNRYHLAEFCAGNGNVGRVFAEQGDVDKVSFVDIRHVSGLDKTTAVIPCSYEILLDGMENFVFPEGRIAVVASHACGSLTDIVLEKAVSAYIPVAVMPCCHNSNMKKYALDNPPDARLLLYNNPEEYYDLVRQEYLIEKRYAVEVRYIDRKITPMNRIIIGIPITSPTSSSTLPQSPPASDGE